MIDEIHLMIKPEHRLMQTKHILQCVQDVMESTSEYYLVNKFSRVDLLDKIIEIIQHERELLKKENSTC
jgi:hypothetical protein